MADVLFAMMAETCRRGKRANFDAAPPPLGAFFADEVAEQFQHPDYIPFPPDQYEDGPLHPLKNAMP